MFIGLEVVVNRVQVVMVNRVQVVMVIGGLQCSMGHDGHTQTIPLLVEWGDYGGGSM